MSSFLARYNFNAEKIQFRIQFFSYLFFGILLIWGGSVIIIDENIFGKFYEKFQNDTDYTPGDVSKPQHNSTTISLPQDMQPLSSDKIATIRKKSTVNLIIASFMIIFGSGIILYDIYTLFLI